MTTTDRDAMDDHYTDAVHLKLYELTVLKICIGRHACRTKRTIAQISMIASKNEKARCMLEAQFVDRQRGVAGQA